MMKHLFFLLICTLTLAACTSTTEKDSEDANKSLSDSTKTSQQNEEDLQKYREIGFEYATSTKQILGKQLVGAITEGGTEHALTFCNIAAIPLTDSMSREHNATITRVSDQPRNPNNKANSKELEQINYYKSLLANGKTGKEIQPNVEVAGDMVHFYYPIITNDMCLKCHGTKNKEVKPETLALLSKLYPEDRATGYQGNKVRGIWSIHFQK